MLACLFALCALPLLSSAQTVVNGQIFTHGLSIVDAPQPGSTYHTGANMPIAIEVSGNGRLKNGASAPGSDLDTRFDALEIFLVSSQTRLNLTVSEGTGLLSGESGSTVKHLDFQVPRCTPAGNYNLTLYERYHLDREAHFAITPLPIVIDNPNKEGDCPTNELRDQPQPSSAPSGSPWLNEDGTVVSFPSNAGVRITASSMFTLPIVLLLSAAI